MVTTRIGGWSVRTLETGLFRLDGGAMFGTVPKVMWSRLSEPDERNRIRLALRCLLLEGHGRRVLVDVGIGGKFPPKLVDIYGIEADGSVLAGALAGAGLGPADITDVLITHFHFDHAGGSTRREGGRLVPALPNARYHVQEQNLANARDPNPRERASYLPENLEPLLEAGVLEAWEGPGSPWPGLEVLVFHGHTRGQQGIRLAGPEGVLYYVADLIPTAAHVRIPFVMGYDVSALESMQEKRALLERAAAERAWIVLEHDPEIAAARPRAEADDFAWEERAGSAAGALSPGGS
jgi:glyoxylase-like metal-dependent hydrolase (beta-lactamase superfamily II)